MELREGLAEGGMANGLSLLSGATVASWMALVMLVLRCVVQLTPARNPRERATGAAVCTHSILTLATARTNHEDATTTQTESAVM